MGWYQRGVHGAQQVRRSDHRRMSVELQTPLIGAAPAEAPKKEEKIPANLRPPTYWQMKNYNFEYYFTTDPYAKPISILVANLICVFVLTILFLITSNLHQLSGVHRFLEILWMSFGKMGGGGGMSPNGILWPTRAVLIIAGFMKMAAFSLLVNFLGDAIDSRMESLMEGKSRVLETDFVRILGWSDKILPLVEQICLANASDGGGPIVVMADMDKPEMDGFLIDNVEEWAGSKLVTRGGNPINPNDLEFVAAPIAKSIVVLSQGFDPDEADAQAARAVLAVTGGMKYQPQGWVVVELRDSDNIPVVKLGISDKFSQEEKEKKVLPMVGASIIGRLMVQCSVEPGLARVFDHILDFSGNEFYFKNWPQLTGQKFANACFSFNDAVCIGICTEFAAEGAEDPVTGQRQMTRVFLNPPGDTIIDATDELIFVAEDDNSYTCADRKFLTPCGKCPDVEEGKKQATRTLCIGWRRDMHEMVFEVDKWTAPGSNLTILAPGTADDGYKPEGPSLEDRVAELEDAECFADKLLNIAVQHAVGNPLLRDDLMKVDIHTFDAVLILTNEQEETEGISCDSRSLVTMLLCRDIQRKANSEGILGYAPVLISEILDPRTAELVSIAAADDHMVSNNLISQCLAQMSQEDTISNLIEDLFNPVGNEMHIKDIRLYAFPGESLSFWELLARGRTRLEVVIGFHCSNFGGELILNPTLSQECGIDKSTPILWQDGDRVVVI